MSVGFIPIFKPEQNIELKSDGGLLLDVLEALDELAHATMVAPLSSFADDREVPDGFDGDPEELQELLGPWDEWFSVVDGVATFNALAEALGHTRHAAAFAEPAVVQEELRDYARCLAAVQPETQFRLEVVL